ncbi:aspartate aminotransferase [Ilyonectria robusta]|uniref:aspartate aminotransferase n=1 Tax=Ilyonectria robusta TaxID=1079257 RepID=UPI001E8DCBFA|nr:aspartate aminotransferase [Ilyonectria robusta]KAH8722243.1 aspartate aminotransferase [Ilyonectria robusta]
MFFNNVTKAAPDVMYHLKVQADGDTSPVKVDLGVGIYRNEQGVYNEMKVLKDAKKDMAAANPDHDYEVTTGNTSFLKNAAKVVFGKDSTLLQAGRVASAQTISGTGAVHIAFLLLSRSVPGMSKAVYVGTPTWGNYVPMLDLVGLEVRTYRHYDPKTGTVDWKSVLNAVRTAEKGTTFILQGCCHNPTAADFTKEQWRILAQEMKKRELFPLFDIAYQGLGNGLEEDIYSVRHFAEQGFEMLVCQSFSKNFGLYGERVGAVHAICPMADITAAVHDQLRFLIRTEFSSSPAYGARLVDIVLSDPSREAVWREELEAIYERLQGNRAKLSNLLINVYKTPGDWSIITKGTGLFSLLPLSQAECKELQDKYHIYLVTNGRVTISGLNEKNIDYVAKSIDKVVRQSQLGISSKI